MLDCDHGGFQLRHLNASVGRGGVGVHWYEELALGDDLDALREGGTSNHLCEEPAGSLLCGFAFAFDRHAKSFAFSFNAYSSSSTSGISVSLLFNFIQNLFDP